MHHQTSVPYILYNIYKKPLHAPWSLIFLTLFLLPPFPSVTISLPIPSYFFFAILPKRSYNPLILFTIAGSRPDITLQKLPSTLQSTWFVYHLHSQKDHTGNWTFFTVWIFLLYITKRENKEATHSHVLFGFLPGWGSSSCNPRFFSQDGSSWDRFEPVVKYVAVVKWANFLE